MVELTKKGNQRQRAPGAGRKANKDTIFKQALEIYGERFPEVAMEMVAKALAQPLELQCPVCKHKWTMDKVPGTGDKDILIHIDNRLLGRAAQTVDHRVTGKITLTADQYEMASRLAITEEKLLLNSGEMEEEKEE